MLYLLSISSRKVCRFMKENEKTTKHLLNALEDDNLGKFCTILSAKSEITGQDGGVVTTLLIKGLKEGLFDSAIVVCCTDESKIKVDVADNAGAVLAAKGTKYIKISTSQKLYELVNQGKKRIAIVCTPCEVKVARKIQQTIARDHKITIIGLFCLAAFNPTKLKNEIKSRLKVDINKAEKIQVDQGKFSIQINRKEYGCKVRDLDCAKEDACRLCNDFTSQLADISVGHAGSQQGYSTIIVRSKIGEILLNNCDFITGRLDVQKIIKLAKFKNERAKKAQLVKQK